MKCAKYARFYYHSPTQKTCLPGKRTLLTSITTTKEQNHKDYGAERLKYFPLVLQHPKRCFHFHWQLLGLCWHLGGLKKNSFAFSLLFFVLTNDGYWRIIKLYPAHCASLFFIKAFLFFIIIVFNLRGKVFFFFFKGFDVVNSYEPTVEFYDLIPFFLAHSFSCSDRIRFLNKKMPNIKFRKQI